jgi:hypothetical protein
VLSWLRGCAAYGKRALPRIARGETGIQQAAMRQANEATVAIALMGAALVVAQKNPGRLVGSA